MTLVGDRAGFVAPIEREVITLRKSDESTHANAHRPGHFHTKHRLALRSRRAVLTHIRGLKDSGLPNIAPLAEFVHVAGPSSRPKEESTGAHCSSLKRDLTQRSADPVLGITSEKSRRNYIPHQGAPPRRARRDASWQAPRSVGKRKGLGKVASISPSHCRDEAVQDTTREACC